MVDWMRAPMMLAVSPTSRRASAASTAARCSTTRRTTLRETGTASTGTPALPRRRVVTGTYWGLSGTLSSRRLTVTCVARGTISKMASAMASSTSSSSSAPDSRCIAASTVLNDTGSLSTDCRASPTAATGRRATTRASSGSAGVAAAAAGLDIAGAVAPRMAAWAGPWSSPEGRVADRADAVGGRKAGRASSKRTRTSTAWEGSPRSRQSPGWSSRSNCTDASMGSTVAPRRMREPLVLRRSR